MLRASHRAHRARLTPAGGRSLLSPPTRGAPIVSRSCQPPAPVSLGAVIPRPVGAERLRAGRALFCRLARGVARPRPAGFPALALSRGLPRGSVPRLPVGSRPFLSAGARRILRPTGAPFCPSRGFAPAGVYYQAPNKRKPLAGQKCPACPPTTLK